MSAGAVAGPEEAPRTAELVADDRGRYVDCNDAAVEMLGYSREELLSKSVWELTPGADEIQGLLLWQEFIRVGSNAGLYRLMRKDGSEVEVHYRAVANVAPGRHLSRLDPTRPGVGRFGRSTTS